MKKVRFFGAKVSVGVLAAAFGSIAVLICVAAYSLYSYYAKPVENLFTFSRTEILSIKIVEENVDSGAVPWGADTKPVAIENVDNSNEYGEADAVVRAMLVPVVYDGEGNVADAESGDIMTPPQGNVWQLGHLTVYMDENWTDNWFFSGGFFYYNRVLAPGEVTPLLIKGATLSGGDYNVNEFTIEILADGLSVGGAIEYWGIVVGLDDEVGLA